jgi:hypothetical protein
MVTKYYRFFWKNVVLDKSKIKSRAGFGKWTFLKMSKIEKPKILLKKSARIDGCDDNALNTEKIIFKLLRYFFL